MASQLKHCPFDGARDVAVVQFNAHFRVHCNSCGAEGPEASDWGGAEKAWNRRARANGDGKRDGGLR